MKYPTKRQVCGVVLCVIFSTLLIITNFLWFNGRKISWHSQIRYNLLLLLLLVMVIVWLRDGKFWPRKLFDNKWQIVWFLAILIVGILARTLFLHHYPPPDGQYIEEVQSGAFLEFPLVNLFAETGIKLFGASMLSIRIPFVFLSSFSIIFFYIACRLFLKTYFGAIFSTGLFAASNFLATSSRIAIEWYTPITTFCLALAGIFYACTRRDWAAFAIAGFTMGLALLEYQGFKFVTLLCLIWFLSYFLTKGNTYCNSPRKAYRFSNLIKQIPKILFMLLFVFITFLPEFVPSDRSGPFAWFTESYYRHQQDIGARRVGATAEQIIQNNLHKIYAMVQAVFLNDLGNLNIHRSMVDYFTGLLGVVAFLYCILFFKQSHAKLLPLITIPTTLVSAGLFSWNPSVKYAVPLIPLYFLTIGIFVDDIKQILRNNKAIIRALTVLLLALMAFNLYTFFAVEMNSEAVKDQFYNFGVIISDQIALLQRNSTSFIYVLSDMTFLSHTGNDYSWLYDSSRMKHLSTEDQLSNVTGYVLAHDSYIDMVKKFSLPEKCKQWKTVFDRNELIICDVSHT